MSRTSSLSPHRTNSAANPVHSCLFQHTMTLDGCKKQVESCPRGGGVMGWEEKWARKKWKTFIQQMKEQSKDASARRLGTIMGK